MGIREMKMGQRMEVFKKDDMDRKKGRRGGVEVRKRRERSGRASGRRARKQEPLRGALGRMRLARRQQINIRVYVYQYLLNINVIVYIVNFIIYSLYSIVKAILYLCTPCRVFCT